MRKSHLLWMFLTALTGVAFPSNPICSNTDKSLVNLYKCYSFGESQFISLSDGLPTFSDGATMGREGSSRWENERIRLCDAEKTYKKNGIVFSICSIGVYVCSYEVLKSDEVTIADLDFRYDGGEYLINYYDCKYEKSEMLDTTYAQTDLQRKATGDIVEWKIYRADGTLKFMDFFDEGYCMSKDGMTRTKKVVHAMFCK